MADRHTHLIERAAARLAETQLARPDASQTRRAFDVPTPATSKLPLLGLQPSAGVQPDSAPTAPHTPELQIDTIGLRKAGLMQDPDSRVAEEFRIIQTRLLRQSFGANGSAASQCRNLVMITSALKGEGKSFVSINLAGEIARQKDRRVLLLDVDPKLHGLSRIFGAASARGLLDLARDPRLSPAELILPTASEGLDVLPVGQSDKRSGEVFASRRMGEVIEAIAEHYSDRLIIIDAPPCLASSTPHALASICGQAVVVVAANSTQETDVEAALELLQVCPHVSLLLNKVAPWMTHSFGSYSYLAAEA
ncbi:MAG: AAA family ATPase [Acidobacteria bacterium]|nr:AAA family ATPase [Acidobacteriota bacterium]